MVTGEPSLPQIELVQSLREASRLTPKANLLMSQVGLFALATVLRQGIIAIPCLHGKEVPDES